MRTISKPAPDRIWDFACPENQDILDSAFFPSLGVQNNLSGENDELIFNQYKNFSTVKFTEGIHFSLIYLYNLS